MSNQIQNLTKNTFGPTVEESDKPVLVDFWAPWCGPCRMLTPVLDEVATEVGDKATVVKVNVDDEPELAEKFGVTSIPNLIVFKNGQLVNRYVGVQDKTTLVEALG